MPPVLRMGKYVVDGLLGPGGVTETYLVHAEPKPDVKPGAAVVLLALKLLRPDRVSEGALPKVVARFLSAARQLRDFHRPGFCRVVDLSEDPSAIFMVSDYRPGCDLGRVLETCRIEGKQGVHPVLVGLIGSEVARLLHVGHSAKPAFCHLGISPQNIILGPSGEVMLLDAGLSASLRSITEQPSERWSLVAPELQSLDVGERPLTARSAIAADLYSLGALLYLLLTGHAPALPESSSGTTVSVEIPEIPGLTGKLAAGLRTLLSREPSDRPGDAATLVEWLAGDIVQVRDRQRLIADGVRAIEEGHRNSSPELPVVTSAPAAQLPAITTAPPHLSTSVPTSGSAALRRTRHFARTAILLVVVLASTAAALVGRGWWSGRAQRREVQVSAQATERRQDVEMPRSAAPRAGVELPAKPVAGDSPSDPDNRLLANVAGHLVVETVPPGAMVWVDGVLAGKTFADIVVGDGGHRIAVIAPGYRMFREVVDTSKGTIIRRTLPEIQPPVRGNGFVDVSCRTVGKYPVLLDDEEIGLLCPAKMVPTSSGKHLVSIFVPQERRTVSVEATVEVGSKPASVSFSQ